jgi:hypothetical protein
VSTPLEEYAQRKRDRELTAKARQRTHVRLGNIKVAIFIAAVIYAAVMLPNVSGRVIGIAAVAFIAFSIWHEVVMRALARAQAAVSYYADGAARIEDRWMREPTPPLRGFVGPGSDHPYADDLDIFGPRSLFQLLSAARTPMGEQRLADWLLRPSPVAQIRERQTRVAALRNRIDLRERIAVVNAGKRRALHTERLIEWAEQPATLPRVRVVVIAMALLFVAAFVNYMYGGRGIFLGIIPVINLALLGWLGKRANHVVETLAGATESAALELIANVIKQVEVEPFAEPELVAISSRLTRDDPRSLVSKRIARLARISDWADSRHNVFLRLSEIPLLFTLQIAYAAESWRARNGSHVRDWIDAIGEMEALLSFAAYSFEHPNDPFAEILEDSSTAFEAVEAAHPLIPTADAVGNTVILAAPDPKSQAPSPRVLIVSGSNMAGKSTLMRTVGINAVLALAGAPVRARRLRLTPLAVGTCLRHSDSLQEHRSGFYTEALRIRLICDLLDGPLPLLFLFDELLSGTNSKDRRIAAEGVVRMMLSRRAIGMVTTHDLALTEIAEMFPGEVKNVHLEDKVENGKMVFDYKLRDGVITHSNALELMRIIGLDV